MRKGVIRQFSIRLFNTTRARAIGINYETKQFPKGKEETWQSSGYTTLKPSLEEDM